MNREANQLEVTKVDARKLKPEAQYEKRKQMIQLYKRGVSLRQMVTDTGMSKSAIERVIKLFESGGMAALAPHARGRRAVIQRGPAIGLAEAIQLIICGGRQRRAGKLD